MIKDYEGNKEARQYWPGFLFSDILLEEVLKLLFGKHSIEHFVDYVFIFFFELFHQSYFFGNGFIFHSYRSWFFIVVRVQEFINGNTENPYQVKIDEGLGVVCNYTFLFLEFAIPVYKNYFLVMGEAYRIKDQEMPYFLTF